MSPYMRMEVMSPDLMTPVINTELNPAMKNQIMERIKGNLVKVVSSYHLLCTFSANPMKSLISITVPSSKTALPVNLPKT